MMTAQEATETFLNSIRALEPLIREYADEAERNRRLSQPVVTALAQAGFFRLYTPQTLGGFEVDPLTFIRVVEALARLDGSTAWCVWIASTNPRFVPTLADQAAEEVFGRDPQVVTAAVFFPYGRAVVQDGGYVVSGRWPYASGCQHSAWVLALCNVLVNGQLRLTERGDSEVRAVFVPATQVTILDTWEVSGLAGTGSHDVVLEQVFVPGEYTCQLGPGLPHSKHFQGPLYRYPAVASGVTALSAIALGIAQGAVDACMDLAHAKRPAMTTDLLRNRPLFQVRLAEAVALVRAARAWLHAAVQQTWESMRVSEQVSFEERADVLLACLNATRSAATAVDMVYTAAGGDGELPTQHPAAGAAGHPRGHPALGHFTATLRVCRAHAVGTATAPVTPNPLVRVESKTSGEWCHARSRKSTPRSGGAASKSTCEVHSCVPERSCAACSPVVAVGSSMSPV